MSQNETIETPQDYVNYTFNIEARGIAEVSSDLMGLSNSVGNILGQLAFKTSEFLTHTEAMAIGTGAAISALYVSATQDAIHFQQQIANVKAIGGESVDANSIGNAAMEYSNKFGMATASMTEGLEALARAGITTTSVMQQVLEEGVKLSKLEGMDLEDSINDLISTTNLLSLEDVDMNDAQYAEMVKQMNQHIVSTSESAPINAQNIIQSLQHVGGYASAGGMDQDDLFAVIAQLGARGTKGEMAGTALRAFIAAGQKDTAQRALARVGLNVSDLWNSDGETMLSVSEMKDVLDQAMEKRGYSKQEKLEFYSDFAGYKQANQIMKINTSEVQQYKEQIANAWDLGKKLDTILGTVRGNLDRIWQITQNFMTKVGSKLLTVMNAILTPVRVLLELFTKIPFADTVFSIGAIFIGFRTGLLVINKIVPALSGFMSGLDKLKIGSRGFRGEWQLIREEIQKTKDIFNFIKIGDQASLAEMHYEEHGLSAKNKSAATYDIVGQMYMASDWYKQNGRIKWDDLGKPMQDMLVERLKPTEEFSKNYEYYVEQTKQFVNEIVANPVDLVDKNPELEPIESINVFVGKIFELMNSDRTKGTSDETSSNRDNNKQINLISQVMNRYGITPSKYGNYDFKYNSEEDVEALKNRTQNTIITVEKQAKAYSNTDYNQINDKQRQLYRKQLYKTTEEDTRRKDYSLESHQSEIRYALKTGQVIDSSKWYTETYRKQLKEMGDAIQFNIPNVDVLSASNAQLDDYVRQLSEYVQNMDNSSQAIDNIVNQALYTGENNWSAHLDTTKFNFLTSNQDMAREIAQALSINIGNDNNAAQSIIDFFNQETNRTDDNLNKAIEIMFRKSHEVDDLGVLERNQMLYTLENLQKERNTFDSLINQGIGGDELQAEMSRIVEQLDANNIIFREGGERLGEALVQGFVEYGLGIQSPGKSAKAVLQEGGYINENILSLIPETSASAELLGATMAASFGYGFNIDKVFDSGIQYIRRDSDIIQDIISNFDRDDFRTDDEIDLPYDLLPSQVDAQDDSYYDEKVLQDWASPYGFDISNYQRFGSNFGTSWDHPVRFESMMHFANPRSTEFDYEDAGFFDKFDEEVMFDYTDALHYAWRTDNSWLDFKTHHVKDIDGSDEINKEIEKWYFAFLATMSQEITKTIYNSPGLSDNVLLYRGGRLPSNEEHLGEYLGTSSTSYTKRIADYYSVGGTYQYPTNVYAPEDTLGWYLSSEQLGDRTLINGQKIGNVLSNQMEYILGHGQPFIELPSENNDFSHGALTQEADILLLTPNQIEEMQGAVVDGLSDVINGGTSDILSTTGIAFGETLRTHMGDALYNEIDDVNNIMDNKSVLLENSAQTLGSKMTQSFVQKGLGRHSPGDWYKATNDEIDDVYDLIKNRSSQIELMIRSFIDTNRDTIINELGTSYGLVTGLGEKKVRIQGNDGKNRFYGYDFLIEELLESSLKDLEQDFIGDGFTVTDILAGTAPEGASLDDVIDYDDIMDFHKSLSSEEIINQLSDSINSMSSIPDIYDPIQSLLTIRDAINKILSILSQLFNPKKVDTNYQPQGYESGKMGINDKKEPPWGMPGLVESLGYTEYNNKLYEKEIQLREKLLESMQKNISSQKQNNDEKEKKENEVRKTQQQYSHIYGVGIQNAPEDLVKEQQYEKELQNHSMPNYSSQAYSEFQNQYADMGDYLLMNQWDQARYKLKKEGKDNKWIMKGLDYGEKIHNYATDKVTSFANNQYQKSQEYAQEHGHENLDWASDKLNTVMQGTQQFKDSLASLSEIFPVLTPAVMALDTALQIQAVVSKGLTIATEILTFAKTGETESTFLQTMANWANSESALQAAAGELALTAATWLANAAEAVLAFLRGLSAGQILLVAAAIAAVIAAILAVKFWEEQHAKSLKESQKALEEATARNNIALSQYQDLKKARENETDAIKKQQAARKEAIALYELEAARINKRRAVHDEAKARNDAVWGEYGLRASMQKMGLGFIAGGDFESQYENYEGTTKNIRRVKEDTLGNLGATKEQQYVAAFYDANQTAFAEIDAYKDDLGKLYDVESKLIEKYGSIEDARDSQEFADAVQEFCDATGIQAETAVKYLDWLETENKVNQASKVAEANVKMVRARADAKAAGIDMDNGGFDSGNMDDVGRAMVYAQVDQMIKDEKHEMWWTMLWEYLQAIISCLFLNFGEASKHTQKALAYQEGVAELEANREQYYQEAMDYYENADRYDYGQGSYSIHADTPFGGAISSVAIQHVEREQQKQYEATGQVMSQNDYVAAQTQYQEDTFGIIEEGVKQQKQKDIQEAQQKQKEKANKKADTTLGQLQNNGEQAHRDALDIIDAIKGKGTAGIVSGSGAGVMSLFNEDNPLFKSLRKKGLRDTFDFMAGEEGTVTEKVVSKGKNIYNEAKAAYGENGLRGIYDYGKQGIKKLGNQGIDFLETKGINVRPYAEKGLDLFRQSKSGAKGLYQSAKAGYAENGVRGALSNIKNTAKSAIYGEAPGMMIMDDGTRVPLGGGKEGLLAQGQRGIKNVANEGRGLYQSAKTAYAEGGIGNVLSKGKDAFKSTSVGGKIADRIGLAREINGLAADGVPVARSGIDKAVGVFDGAKAAYAEDGIRGVAKFGKEAGKSGVKSLASDTSGILSKGAEGLKNSYKPGAALGEAASVFNPKNLAGGIGDIAKGLKGGGTLLKGIGRIGGPALMALGPALAFADKASELNPFDGPHYNEDGSEKKALQATGEVVGTTAGAVGGVVGGLEGAAAGAAIGTAILPGIGTAIGAVAGGIAGGWLGDTIFQPIGEAIGGTIGWLGDNLLGGIQNVAGTVWDGLTGAAGGVWDAVSGAASGVWDFLTGGGKSDQPVGGLLGFTPIGMGINAAAGIWDWLSGGDKKNDPYANIDNVGQQKNPKSVSQNQNTIVIKNININTEDDPEKIKSALMNLIIEMQEQINPRQVSRTVGEPPAQSTSDTQNTNNQAQAQGTDPQSGAQNGNSNTGTNSTNTNANAQR